MICVFDNREMPIVATQMKQIWNEELERKQAQIDKYWQNNGDGDDCHKSLSPFNLKS